MNITLEDLKGHHIDGLEFCAAAYALFDSMCSAENGQSRFMTRSDTDIKKLVEEVLPICRYIQLYYRPGRYFSVLWPNDSQSYDAELCQEGELVSMGFYKQYSYLEVTSAMHENEHWTGKLLADGQAAYAPEGVKRRKGCKLPESKPFVFQGEEFIKGFAPIVMQSIQRKINIATKIGAEAPHRPSSLVIQCYLNHLYTPWEWRTLVQTVESELTGILYEPYSEILLLSTCGRHETPLILTTKKNCKT